MKPQFYLSRHGRIPSFYLSRHGRINQELSYGVSFQRPWLPNGLQGMCDSLSHRSKKPLHRAMCTIIARLKSGSPPYFFSYPLKDSA